MFKEVRKIKTPISWTSKILYVELWDFKKKVYQLPTPATLNVLFTVDTNKIQVFFLSLSQKWKAEFMIIFKNPETGEKAALNAYTKMDC